MPQLALQQYSFAPQVLLPHAGPVGGGVISATHAQTEGSPFHTVPFTHSLVLGPQLQMPPQSAPPLAGSQLSLGSS